MKRRIKLHLLKVLLLIVFLFLAYLQWHKEGTLVHHEKLNSEQFSEQLSNKFAE